MAESMTTLGGGEAPEEDESEDQSQEDSESNATDHSGNRFDFKNKGLSDSEEKATGFRDGFSKGWNKARSKGKDAAKKGAEKAGKKVAEKAGEEVAKKAVEKGAQTAVSKGIGSALGTALGGPLGTALGYAVGSIVNKLLFDRRVHWAIAILLLIIILMIWAAIAGVTLAYIDGGLTGGTPKVNTDLSNPEHKKTISDIENLTGSSGLCGKRLEFGDPKDLEMIKSGDIDYRILVAIKTIAEKNTHIKISHVANLLSSIPANTIETHSTVQETYLDNTSAHKDGMAFDIVEVGCVFEKCTCSEQCGCKQIPIQVAWQNLGNGTQSIASVAGLNKVNELLGLPEGSLGGIDANDMFKNTGLAGLSQDLGMDFENIKDVASVETLMDKYGQSEVEELLSLPTGSLTDQKSLAAYATSAGKQRMEDVLSLPSGSLSGSSSAQVFKSSGQQSVEQELNLPSGILSSDPQKAYDLLKDKNLTSQQKSYIEKTIGWPTGTINNLMTSLKTSNTSATKDTLVATGKDVLEQAFGLDKGEFDTPGSAPISASQGKEEDQKYGLPEGTFTGMLEDLKNNQNTTQNMINVGASKLETSLYLPPGTVQSVIDGKTTPEQALQRSDEIYPEYDSYLSSELLISQTEARTLRQQILQGQPVSETCQKIGINKFENYVGIKSGTLSSLINGSLSPEDFLRQNISVLSDMASSLGISQSAVNAMFSGDFTQGLVEYGQNQIGEVFGLSSSQLTSLIQSGDISSIIQSQAITAISNILGVNAGVIGSILTGNMDITSVISMGVSILYGGGIGSIFSGVLGGFLGGTCTTSCYGPTATANVRKVIGQALDLYKTDPSLKPTQIITFKETDVNYFSDKLNDLYGENRQPNYGLFTRPEAQAHIHIGY